MKHLAGEEKLAGCKYIGYWHPLGSLSDKNLLVKFWKNGKASWKEW